MRKFLILPALSLAAASQAATMVTLDSSSYFATYNLAKQRYEVTVTGVIDNTTGSANILGTGLITEAFGPTVARFFAENEDITVPVGGSYSGVLGVVGYTGPQSAYGQFRGVAVDSAFNNFSSDIASIQTVPEPASMAALGLGAVAMIRRRR